MVNPGDAAQVLGDLGLVLSDPGPVLGNSTALVPVCTSSLCVDAFRGPF